MGDFVEVCRSRGLIVNTDKNKDQSDSFVVEYYRKVAGAVILLANSRKFMT